LAHFRFVDYIREASLQQLAEVNGIGLHLAQHIFNYFHPQSDSEIDSIH